MFVWNLILLAVSTFCFLPLRLTSEVEDLKTKLQLALEELGKSREAFDDFQQEHQLMVNNLEIQLQDVQLQLSEAKKEQEVKQNDVSFFIFFFFT